MTTERFSQAEFEKALTNAIEDTGLFGSDGELEYNWNCLGYLGNELRYNIIVKTYPDKGDYGLGVAVCINSSIGPSGFADGTGENSIRIWIADQDGKPLGSKVSRWVTRVSGWQRRLSEKLAATLSIAENINYCDKCGTLQKVFIVKKDGPNKGRLFRKCECERSFIWLDEFEEQEEIAIANQPTLDLAVKVAQTELDEYYQNMSQKEFEEERARDAFKWERDKRMREAYERSKQPEILCPDCGGPMIKRHRHSDGAPFYGCKQFPNCRGTRDGSYVPSDGSLETSSKPTTERKSFIPSRYQQDIFKWVQDTNSHSAEEIIALMIEALAGTGKTTTGVRIFNILSRAQKIVFVAFNNHIAKDMRRKLPRWANVMTCHALGRGAIAKAFPDFILDKNNEDDDGNIIRKTKLIFDQVTNYNVHGHLYSVVANLVSKVKNTASDTDPDTLMRLAEFYNLEDDLGTEADIIFQLVATIIARSMQMTHLIDFDDMVWLPVVLDLPMPQYDFVFVDEAQDINRVQEELIFKSVGPGSRVVMAGDRYQSLYGFRGANVDAIPNLIENTNAEVLPLNICYRCAKAIIRHANEQFPHIPLEPADDAPEGIVRSTSEELAATEWRDGDMVLCRVNAPLVSHALECVRNGVKAIVRGRNISKGLIKLVKKMEAENTADLIAKLYEYEIEEVQKLLLAEKKGKAQMVEDQCDTIIAVCNHVGLYEPVQVVIDKIDGIFSDKNEGVVFSSVHRAKGLEAKRVYILRPDLMPHPRAESAWELQQEDNIRYVAVTRAEYELVYTY